MAGLNLISLPPGCGYGDAAVQYLAGLKDCGVPLTWTPILSEDAERQAAALFRHTIPAAVHDKVVPLWRCPLECDAMLVDVPPGHWQRHWRQAEPDWRACTYCTWELEEVPDDWPGLLEGFDRVFVPSTFNKRAIEWSDIAATVDVVPHIARTIDENVPAMRWGDVSDDDFVFYTIGTWTSRKAMDETVNAYLEAFTRRDKVALIIKTDPVDRVAAYAMSTSEPGSRHVADLMVWRQLARLMARYPSPAKIHLIADNVPQVVIDALHMRGDCFVSLTRSEGWGLGAFDAVLFGNPVVITGYGGHLDYLGEDYPLLVPFAMKPVNASSPDGYFVESEEALWAHADRAQAVSLMRRVYGDRHGCRVLARDLCSDIVQNFSSGKISRHLAELMGYTPR